MTKHPALMTRPLRERVERMDETDLESLPGRESFTPAEKQFLAVYPWFGQKKMAAEYIGRSSQWYDRRQRQNPMFRQAVYSRAGTPSRIARQYLASMLLHTATLAGVATDYDTPCGVDMGNVGYSI